MGEDLLDWTNHREDISDMVVGVEVIGHMMVEDMKGLADIVPCKWVVD